MRMARWNQSVGTEDHARAGLDITDTHAHWVVLGRRGLGWQVRDYQQWPLRPGWVENGQVLAYQELVEALQQWLAGNQVRDLSMALPPEVCFSRVLEQPPRLLPWGRRRWLAACAADLMQRPVSQLSWSAYELPGGAPRWRLIATGLEQVQDWLGLAEAMACDCQLLDESHQAAWRALDRWQEPLPPGAWLFQASTGCVQALREQDHRWQWAWRDQGQVQDLIPQCLASAGDATVFVLGQSPLAQALAEALSAAGLHAQQPELCDRLHWASDLLLARRSPGYWTALGLADRQRLA